MRARYLISGTAFLPVLLFSALFLVASQGAIIDAEGTRPKVLLPVIGASPKGETEGSTEHAPTPEGNDPTDTHPDGALGEPIAERGAQLKEDGYDVEIRYFTSMQAFLCWARTQADSESPPKFRHVEFYGHGSKDGPQSVSGTPGFGGAGDENTEALRWEQLGQMLRRLMTSGTGESGHIVFGWCHSAGGPAPFPPKVPTAFGKRFPGAIVAGKSGRVVYGLDKEIMYQSLGSGIGEPYSQPYPMHPMPPSPELPAGDSGWRKFPPTVPADPEDPDPEEPEVPNPGDGGPVVVPSTSHPGRLPKSPDVPPEEDPHAGNNPPPSSNPTDTEPAGPPPSPLPPIPDAASMGC